MLLLMKTHDVMTADADQKAAKAPNLYALNIFGKPARQTNCDCERVTDPTLLQTIYTRNDPSLLGRIEDKNGTAWIEEAFGLKPGQRGQPEELKEKAKTTVDAVVRRTTWMRVGHVCEDGCTHASVWQPRSLLVGGERESGRPMAPADHSLRGAKGSIGRWKLIGSVISIADSAQKGRATQS